MNRMIHNISFLVLIPFLIATGCSKSDRNPEKASTISNTADVIRLEGGDWGYPTPYAHYPRGPGGFKMCLIFDSLLERSTTGLIPWLAESWEILDDGKRYRFTIRDGIVWHDGTSLTTEDVCFSLSYASVHPMTWSSVYNSIESVQSIDSKTIEVTVRHVGAAMLYNIGKTRLLPKHIWEHVTQPKTFTGPEAVIGTGPYRLTSYSKEHGTYRFEAFQQFWGPKQTVRCIEYVPVSEPVLAFENRTIDLITVPPDLISRYENSPEYTIVKNPAFWGYRLLFNMDAVALLRETDIRRAFRYALDLDELVTKIARGAAISGSPGVLPPDHVMYRKPEMEYRYDPVKAIALLNSRGFTRLNRQGVRTGTDGNSLTFNLLCSSREVRMAEIIRQRLGEAGIHINIVSVDGKTRDAKIIGNNFQLAITGHGGWGADPDYLRERFSVKNDKSLSPSVSGRSGYVNPELNRLLEQQRMEMDTMKRMTLIGRVQELLAEELPEIPLFNTTSQTVFRPTVYNGWKFMFDHHAMVHSKLSYLDTDWKHTEHGQTDKHIADY